MDHAEALAWLDRRVNREAVAGRTDDLSLDAVERVLHVLGDPHRTYPVIHVTGTNGKGSVVRMIAALLQAHGLSVGTTTSPHLHSVAERLRWDDEPIAPEDLAALIATVADAEALAGVTLSWFEAITVAALVWFAEIAVDVAVVEVGLLGRFDATNVVHAAVAVLTNVSRDHTDGEGDWRLAIAREKLGIVEPDSWLVVGEPDEELEEVLATVEAAAIWRRGEDFDLEDHRTAVGGRLVAVRTPFGELEELFLPVHGEHQGVNAAVAIAAVSAFFGRALTEGPVADGLASLSLPGRFEVLGRSPLVVVDGAHNLAAAAATVLTLEDDFEVEGRRTLVIGMLADKDVDLVLDVLDVSSWDRVIATIAPSPRSLGADAMAERIAQRGVVAEVIDDPARAVARAVVGATDDDAVLVIGSTYLAAVARSQLLED